MILTTRPGTSFWRDYVDGSQGTMNCRVLAPRVDKAMRVCPSEIPFVHCSLRRVPRILAGRRAGRSRDGATAAKLELVTNLWTEETGDVCHLEHGAAEILRPGNWRRAGQ